MLENHPLGRMPVHAALELVFGEEIVSADEAIDDVTILLDDVLAQSELGETEGHDGGVEPDSAQSLPDGEWYTLFFRTRSLAEALPPIVEALEQCESLRYARLRAALPLDEVLQDVEEEGDDGEDDAGDRFYTEDEEPYGAGEAERDPLDEPGERDPFPGDAAWVALDEVLVERRTH